jgi:NADPH:quinone reductase-like Zn-dependent oxidoreductase
MKALILKRYGGADALEFTEVPRPTIKPDEILVQVYAAGLNPIDYMIPKGDFKPLMPFKLPATMGSDLAGIVLEVGSSVRRFKVGDAVYASLFDLGVGSFAEFVAVPEHAAALKPASLDFVQAASMPMVGLTSWQAFTERAQIKPGQKVFIPAGSGGIGTFAIQLAKQLGAKVATTTSTANLELVRSLGADEVVDYKQQEFEDVLRGYDAVLGTVRGDALEKSLRILKPDSKVVSLIGPPDAAFARKRGSRVLIIATDTVPLPLACTSHRWCPAMVEQRPQELHPAAAVIAEVQRLRHQQRRQVPRQVAAFGDLAGLRIDQHRLVQARGQRLVAAHEDAVVVRAGERRAGEGDEGRPSCPVRPRVRCRALLHRSQRAGGGRPLYGASISAISVYCQYFSSRSAQVLIMPVAPTTSAHTA